MESSRKGETSWWVLTETLGLTPNSVLHCISNSNLNLNSEERWWPPENEHRVRCSTFTQWNLLLPAPQIAFPKDNNELLPTCSDTPLCAVLVLPVGPRGPWWLFRPMGCGSSNAMWLSRLGHKRDEASALCWNIHSSAFGGYINWSHPEGGSS